MTTTKELLTTMFKENTGQHFLDSGGAYGRAWQRNQSRDFDAEPSATLELHEDWDPEVTVSTYHMLAATLELDALCRAFNAIPTPDWDGELAWGISTEHDEFLNAIGADVSEAWNTYNWDNCFDQVLQGNRVEINQEEYVLIQVHGGCDVRGGYTDAKLFKVYDPDYFLCDDAIFSIPNPTVDAETPDMFTGDKRHDHIYVDYRAHDGLQVYHPDSGEQTDFDPTGIVAQTIEGEANAVCH